MAAEPVAAEEFAAVRHAAHVLRAEMLAREVKKTVVERAVRAQDDLRPDVVEDRAETVHAEQPMARRVQPGNLQEVEIQVVRPGEVALDAVIQAYPKAVERVGVLQALVDLDVIRRGVTVRLARPVHERTGPHVVAAPGAGCENECAHDGRESWDTP